MTEIHLLLAAAGGSQRMGTPKQLLAWGEDILIQHQIKTLQMVKKPITVVLGASSNEIKKQIEKLSIDIVVHNEWEKGMGASIAYGVKSIMEQNINCKGVLICLVDQPLITSVHYENLLLAFQVGQEPIIVSQSQQGIWSAPVLFDKFYFKDLINLKGEIGAKKVVMSHSKKVHLVTCETSLEDIDTPEAYREMLAKTKLKS
jgi:molybdenum cofactor cytidylyltransferase